MFNNVQSSNVEMFGYEVAEQLLQVRFRSGRTYTYRGVPLEVYSQLEGALKDADASFGKTFNSLIRQGGYEYEEITE